MSIIDSLITNRTADDVNRAAFLKSKGWAALSTDEKSELLDSIGIYKAADLNRVGQAQTYLENLFDALPAELKQYLADAIDSILASLIYDKKYYDLENPILPDSLAEVSYNAPINLAEIKTDWANGDFPAEHDDAANSIYSIAYYLANMQILKGLLELPPPVPELPQSLNGLNWAQANAIEEILAAINTAYEAYEAEKKSAIDLAEQEAKERYRLMALSWVYSGEVYAGEV